MRRYPSEADDAILKRLLEGNTYRKIAAEFEVSLAKVSTVAEDARRKIPDFDELRGLSIMLKKRRISLFDAMRGCNMLEALNKLGISLEELGNYINATERLQMEKGLGDDFITSVIKLMQLEQTYGQPYRQVLQDFEQNLSRLATLDAEHKDLENKLSELKSIKEGADKELAQVITDIEKAAVARRALAKIGLDRFALLLNFIQEFESLGFDALYAKQLAALHTGLKELNINPDTLGEYIAQKGILDAQILNLKLERERLEADVTTLSSTKENMLRDYAPLNAVYQSLKTGTLTMPCKSCQAPLLIGLDTGENYEDAIRKGLAVSVWCPRCGFQLFDPREIASYIGWILLPTITRMIVPFASQG